MRPAARAPSSPDDCIAVSALTGEGIDALRAGDPAPPRRRMEQESGFITSLRHEQLLRESRE